MRFEAARALNAAGRSASLDLLGENVSDEAGARNAADGYVAMFNRIARENLNANVSLKLTQLGLDLSESLCQELVERIVAHATDLGQFCAHRYGRLGIHAAHRGIDEAGAGEIYRRRHGDAGVSLSVLRRMFRIY